MVVPHHLWESRWTPLIEELGLDQEFHILSPDSSRTVRIPSKQEHSGKEKNTKGRQRGSSSFPSSHELLLSGVGHRWSLQRLGPASNPTLIRRLRRDVGTSHPRVYLLPSWIEVELDASSTKRVLRVPESLWSGSENRKGKEEMRGREMRRKVALASVVKMIHDLRPRSPYTGQGMVQTRKRYPKLKSTKTSKK